MAIHLRQTILEFSMHTIFSDTEDWIALFINMAHENGFSYGIFMFGVGFSLLLDYTGHCRLRLSQAVF